MMEPPLSAIATTAKALGHPARLRLLAMLSGGPLCVCQMTAVLAVASSTVSEHLRELRRAGLLVERRNGKFVFYQLASSRDATRWVQVVGASLAGDPVAAADAELVARLRRVPVEEFAATGGRIPRPGKLRPGGSSR